MGPGEKSSSLFYRGELWSRGKTLSFQLKEKSSSLFEKVEWLLYIIGLGGVMSGVMVITAGNPGYSIFWLILVYMSVVGLLVLLGVEYIGLILLIIYVGAIGILYVFVIMMLKKSDGGKGGYQWVGGILGIVFYYEMMILGGERLGEELRELGLRETSWGEVSKEWNIESIGGVLYTEYGRIFILVSMILLVGIIGAVVLTEAGKQEIKRQEGYKQKSRELWK